MAAAVSTSPASEKNERALVGARGEDRHDLSAGDEPDDVEVVDRTVPKQAAARRDVGRVRRRLVVGAGPDGVDETELAVGHRLARPLVAAVEATLEPDVDRHVGALDQLGEAEGLVEGRGDRLLAERRHAGRDAEAQQRGVTGVAVAMTNASTPDASSASGDSANPTPSRSATLRAASGTHVRDDELVDEVEPGQRLRVEGADPSDAGKPDAHTHSLVFDDRPAPASDRSARATNCQANVRTL